MWKKRSIYLMILPVVVWFLIFAYQPMTWLRMAFYDFKLLKGFEGSKFVGFQNFIAFFTEYDAPRLIWNTLAINLLALLILFPAPIILALLLNELRSSRLKKSVQTVSYLPHFLSTVMLVGFLNVLLSPSLGILGKLLASLGFKNILYDPNWFRALQVISGLWQTVGWNSIIYVAALSGVDPALYEAAKIDGASRWKQTLHVTLPALVPTIVIMLLMQIASIMGSNFEKILLMQNDLNIEVSEVVSSFVYTMSVGSQAGHYGLSTAAGLFNSVVALILVVIANRVTKKTTETSLW